LLLSCGTDFACYCRGILWHELVVLRRDDGRYRYWDFFFLRRSYWTRTNTLACATDTLIFVCAGIAVIAG
jgi:hypothetical protein